MRRESVVIRGLSEHARAVGDTASELNRAVASLCAGDKTKAVEALGRMVLSEKEADMIEETMSEELSKGDLEPKEREDLLRMVRRMDYIADWAKEAGMNLQLILEADVKVPSKLWAMYQDMTRTLEQATKEVRSTIESVGVNEQRANEHAREVKRLEHILDEFYFSIKKKSTSLI